MESKKGLKKALKPKKVNRSSEQEQKNFRLVVAYVGTNYQGWQKQAIDGGPDTIQEMLEKAARKVLRKKKIVLHGSGRTDSGVHARGQVAHLRAAVDLPAKVLIKALNANLPPDIRIINMKECPENFHSQLDATAKTYRYFILNTPGNPVHWPFLRPYSWFVTYALDFAAMKKSLALLEGRHDFRSFQNKGTPVEDTTREILEASLIIHEIDPKFTPPWMPGPEFEGTLFEIRIRGTGFLKQMVRNIAGTVVEVGRGRLKSEKLLEILAKKDRTAGGMTAPAYGLFLDHVEYDLL